MDEVSAYVSEKLLEDFNDTINDTNADISNNYSRKIAKEVELAPEDLGPDEEQYKEELD